MSSKFWTINKSFLLQLLHEKLQPCLLYFHIHCLCLTISVTQHSLAFGEILSAIKSRSLRHMCSQDATALLLLLKKNWFKWRLTIKTVAWLLASSIGCTSESEHVPTPYITDTACSACRHVDNGSYSCRFCSTCCLSLLSVLDVRLVSNICSRSRRDAPQKLTYRVLVAGGGQQLDSPTGKGRL